MSGKDEKLRVLLVENEADISRLISYVLEANGFSVDQAHSADIADQKLEEEKFDIILLDLMLPGEDGYSLCRRLKASEGTKSIPVIMISARVMPDEIKKGLDCGASGYIGKPYDPLTLGDEIRKIYDKALEDKEENS